MATKTKKISVLKKYAGAAYRIAGLERALKAGKDGGMGNLETPNRVWKPRKALYEKAKNETSFRFYSLSDKICDREVLEEANRRQKANNRAPGVDGGAFEMIEEGGRGPWLDALAKALREKTYKSGAVKRKLILKENRKMRPLGIPNIRDRVARQATVLILSCIIEADLPEETRAYREGRSAKEAAGKVQRPLNRDRYLNVSRADLPGCFDAIPHPEPLKIGGPEGIGRICTALDYKGGWNRPQWKRTRRLGGRL
jgi:RNA-directed DNA polymerase